MCVHVYANISLSFSLSLYIYLWHIYIYTYMYIYIYYIYIYMFMIGMHRLGNHRLAQAFGSLSAFVDRGLGLPRCLPGHWHNFDACYAMRSCHVHVSFCDFARLHSVWRNLPSSCVARRNLYIYIYIYIYIYTFLLDRVASAASSCMSSTQTASRIQTCVRYVFSEFVPLWESLSHSARKCKSVP